MSGSEPGEMGPKSSQVMVMPKFDMHIYTSELTAKKLKDVITEYCIPTDLHPRHWFSFENKTGGRSKKCFKEVTSSLKGWKKKFFLLDLRVVPDAMPWRHTDTVVRDDFPNYYNKSDAARLAEVTVPFRPPPRHLLYVCGLTTACRHPELSYTIKDPEGKGNKYDESSCKQRDSIPKDQRPRPHVTPSLAVNEPIPQKSPVQKAIEKPDPKIVAAREKKDKQNLAKATVKRSERTISITPLHHFAPTPADETVTSVPKNITRDAATGPQTANPEKEVVDLSENTRVPTPPITVVQPSPHAGRNDTQEQVCSTNCLVFLSRATHSIHSTHHEDDGESTAEHRFMPEWGLHDDLHISSARACKEMLTHLATPTEKEFLGDLINVEVVIRPYQSLGRCVLSQSELLKRHEELNSEHVALCHRNDIQLEELNRLRTNLQRQMQTNDGLSKRLALLDNSHSSCEDKERELLNQLKEMEKERNDWRRIASEQVEKIKRLEEAIEPKSKQLADTEERL
ncbi:hypothetical protein Tco_0072800 [Tanacetum coccineum]